MNTATVSIEIVCPDWCTQGAESHAEDLSNLDGCCDHRIETVIADTTGYIEPPNAPVIHQAIHVSFASLGRIEGGEAASPTVYIDGAELSVQQAEDLATALRTMIDTYRTSGGVA